MIDAQVSRTAPPISEATNRFRPSFDEEDAPVPCHPRTQPSFRIDRSLAGFESGGDAPRVVPLSFHEAFIPRRRMSKEDAKRLAIRQAAIRLVAGLELRSLRKVAREIGCTHTAIDNCFRNICESFGLHKFVRSEETRARLRASRARQIERAKAKAGR